MTTKLEQAAQNLLDYFDIDDCGILFNSRMEALREALAEQAEQEPVAYTNSDQLGYLKDPLYENAPMAMWSKPFDKRINVSLYAAPVRTKDLTDDEIVEAVGVLNGFDAFRAVISADREKNSHEKTN